MKTKILLASAISFLFILGCSKKSQKLIPPESTEKIDTSQIETRDTLQNTSLLFDFENYELDKLPAGWSQYFTGRGTQTDWKVVEYNGNKVLAQLSSNNPSYHFNVIVYDSIETKNVKLTVKFKAFKGRIDQGGGFVWRFIDKNNYYILRANPLENNVVMYRVKNGKRKDLPLIGKGRTYGVKVKPLRQNWHQLAVEVQDDIFIAYLDGEELFRVQDTTFKNPGKIGLWTKADAQTYFDSLLIEIK